MCNIQNYQPDIIKPLKEAVLCLTGGNGEMGLDPGKLAEFLPDLPIFVTLNTADTKRFLSASLLSFKIPDDSFLIMKAGNNYLPIRKTDEKDAALEIMQIRLDLVKKEIRSVEKRAEEEKPKTEKPEKTKNEENDQKRYIKQIQMLTDENQSMKAQNERLMKIVRESHKGQQPLLYVKSIEEFYPDEIRQVLLDILEKGRNNLSDGSRRQEIVDAILEDNEKTDLLKQKSEEMRSIIRSTERFSQEQANRFRQAGFDVEKLGSGHWKLIFHGNPRYSFTISTSPSDFRSAQETEHTFVRALF